MSTDTDTEEKPKPGRANWSEHQRKNLERAALLGPVKYIENTLKYDAPEREWEAKRYLVQKAIDLAKISDVDGDVIAWALLRLLFPNSLY